MTPDEIEARGKSAKCELAFVKAGTLEDLSGPAPSLEIWCESAPSPGFPPTPPAAAPPSDSPPRQTTRYPGIDVADLPGETPPKVSVAWRAAFEPSFLDDLFEVLGRTEGDLLARLDLDGLTGRRIAAHPGSTLADL
jgi:hypothetical protein